MLATPAVVAYYYNMQLPSELIPAVDHRYATSKAWHATSQQCTADGMLAYSLHCCAIAVLVVSVYENSKMSLPYVQL
jgi:hypothetical protein